MTLRSVLVRRAGFAMAACVAGLAGGEAVADDAPTFAQVLAAPDDPQINLAYAQNEAANGNLLYAAAALERVLIAHPNANSVRLFYVAVLYRLNDLQGAKDQIRQLEGAHLTPQQQSELDKYRDLVERGQSSTHLTGDVIAGIDFETDSVGSVIDLFDNLPNRRHVEKNGVAAIGAVDANLSSDFGPNGDYAVLASASVYTRTAIAGPTLNYDAGMFSLGVGGSSLHSSWSLSGIFNDYMLFDDPYLYEYGGRAQGIWHETTSIAWVARAEFVRQTYHQDPILSLPLEGNRYTISAGGIFRFDGFQTLSANVGYEGKSARFAPQGYDALFLNADYHVLLGRGVYGDLSGDIRSVNYRGHDPSIFGIHRMDTRGDARLAFGAPLSAFADGGATGDWRENVIIEESVSYADRVTEFPLANFNSVGAQLRLIWNFSE
jgi:hypothetical protein